MNLTYKEIMEQYRSMTQTKAYLDERISELSGCFDVKNYSSLIVLGCGSSYSLAKSFAQIANMHTSLPSTAMPAGDVLLHAPRYSKCFEGALVLAISRSGSTSEVLMALNALKAEGCRFTIASFTCRENSELSKISDIQLVFPWAYDNSVCQTRTVSCLYYAFAYLIARILHEVQLLAELDHVVATGEQFIQKIEPLMLKTAKEPWSHVIVLGDAEICGIAEEGALAFKEICQLPSNYYHLLDTRHGPMVLIQKDTLILAALGPNNKLEQDFLRDMSQKTPYILAFSDKPADISGVQFITYDYEIGHIAKGLPFILICQLLSYHKALVRGTDPDAPTGLDAWISL